MSLCTILANPVQGWPNSAFSNPSHPRGTFHNCLKDKRFNRATGQLGVWHRGCSIVAISNPLKELSMKLLFATMFKKVPVRKTTQRATICKRCGTRIYSLSFLKVHLESHARNAH